MIEKLQLFRRCVDLLAVHDQLIGVKVDDELVENEAFVCVVGDLAAAQYRVDTRKQLFHLKGLDNIVVRAHLEAMNAVVDLTLGSEHDDRALGRFADLGAYAPTIEHGEHHVKQHEIRLFFLEFFYRLAAVGCDADFKALFVEIHFDEVGNIVIVLYDKNIACHALIPFHTTVCLSSVMVIGITIIRETAVFS